MPSSAPLRDAIVRHAGNEAVDGDGTPVGAIGDERGFDALFQLADAAFVERLDFLLQPVDDILAAEVPGPVDFKAGQALAAD